MLSWLCVDSNPGPSHARALADACPAGEPGAITPRYRCIGSEAIGLTADPRRGRAGEATPAERVRDPPATLTYLTPKIATPRDLPMLRI
jgi:hypothetical protein